MEGWRQPPPRAPRGSRVAMESRRRPGGGRPRRRYLGHRSRAGPRSAAGELAALGSAFCAGPLTVPLGLLRGEINWWGLERASSGGVGCACRACCGASAPCDSKERTCRGAGRSRASLLPEPCALRAPAFGRRAGQSRPRHSPCCGFSAREEGPASVGQARAGGRADPLSPARPQDLPTSPAFPAFHDPS